MLLYLLEANAFLTQEGWTTLNLQAVQIIIIVQHISNYEVVVVVATKSERTGYQG